ncbi:MAG: hypothetical protein ABSG84_12630 [Acidobacteriaceae bacterium]|jgi:hypothetical protein
MTGDTDLRVGVLSVALLGLSACGSTVGTLQPAASADVYLAGFEQGTGNAIAMVWKNGVGTQLTDPTHGAIALGIAVSGSDVYVVGNDSAPGEHQIAVIWKNGVETALTDGTKDGYASGISISGTDVYVSGSEIGFDASGNPYFAAEYWKNGAATILSNSLAGEMTNAIFVSGSDVYVAGYQNVTTQTGPSSYFTTQVVFYWKNGVPIQLTNGITPAVPFSIFVSGSDVYVSGYNCLTTAGGCERAAYWVNGNLFQLPTTNPSTAVAIAAANGNAYVADNETLPSGLNEALLWTNGSEDNLAQGGAANAVAVFGKDVYVAGCGPNFVAAYFKNDGIEEVKPDTNTNSSAFAIAVVPHQ